MSQINVDNIKGRTGGAVSAPAGIVVTGVGTFSGNVSIGGTLSYEDVTNIDSVGIITARAGIVVTAGVSTFGGNVLPQGNGSKDLGATNQRWANLYTSDLDLSNEAKGVNEKQMFEIVKLTRNEHRCRRYSS